MKAADDIVDVWAHNLETEIEKIAQLLPKYHYVGMDTEFSGFFVKSPPVTATDEVKYQAERENVNRMKIIQIGITLADDDGKVPQPICTWQFNFKFDVSHDMQSLDSINLLYQSGIDFQRFAEDGIDLNDFIPIFFSSGLVMNEHVIWITFAASYDIAYLVKLVTADTLPKTSREFDNVVKTYFPHYYDVRYMIMSIFPGIGSLQSTSKDLGVVRFGPMHQAGSDSYVTLLSYFAACRKYFKGAIVHDRFRNKSCK
ncbi:CAF1 family ribonuclease containing protein [Trichomonas vaginalis G3]|uniref:poly(A)-specific ribonuclease n=1 Tax=Trichomonas vaginalis (strain ATCC PRA-98 / G3) TaxID=412133 RepID=A2E5A8_TRIV3|nr:exonucleolytic nuclear-transcribed mRNA catabolic process involved in deadenylation-dependent decay [Trichomonas vaginalis G3]EAY12188.1 CAF1 family ribonuclease containing protein [Trichomonas vaginalis G3]KAI5515425.1 exonucleolytic nuclear-transcribed mRNA catabolic process involved in deadenylation-dependent decay [Trichomonas vaginalis G3]|eukprot:XP_001324411.1 CAF1 family ribonuclease containing protein [Trichomonas vaginalis G3]